MCVLLYVCTDYTLFLHSAKKYAYAMLHNISHRMYTYLYFIRNRRPLYIFIYLFYNKFVDTSGYTIRARIGNRYIS